MTTEKTEATKTKQVPAFYIFEAVEGSEKNENKRVGAMFPHKKGKGMNLVINGKRYAAFPPKAKPADQPELSEQPAQAEGA